MNWLDKISLPTLLIIAVPLALVPFVPEPHLVQKIKMLVDGSLVKPVDIFDLFMHGTPSVLVIIKLIRLNTQKK